jgi:hypothetical protein
MLNGLITSVARRVPAQVWRRQHFFQHLYTDKDGSSRSCFLTLPTRHFRLAISRHSYKEMCLLKDVPLTADKGFAAGFPAMLSVTILSLSR